MSIGVCCQWMEEKNARNGTSKWINALEERNLLYGAFLTGKYSKEQIIAVYTNNLNNLREKLPLIISKGIKSFRISSNILPLIDQVTDDIRYSEQLSNALSLLGKMVLENKIRLTVHPDQFCVISSKRPDVIKNSFKILEHHAWIFDRMGLPQNNYYAINIHGGVKGQSKTLIESINALPQNVKSRLTLENEELAYTVEDLYEIYKETGTPIVFDSHHHKFNAGNLSASESMDLAVSTWKEKPLTHLSNTEPGMENAKFQDRRKHSAHVHYIPEYQLKANNDGIIDIDFEFKMKNIAILKAANDFGINL
jgi:UV DNA damage endonuclease